MRFSAPQGACSCILARILTVRKHLSRLRNSLGRWSRWPRPTFWHPKVYQVIVTVRLVTAETFPPRSMATKRKV